MPGWHNALCNSSKEFSEGSDIETGREADRFAGEGREANQAGVCVLFLEEQGPLTSNILLVVKKT